MNIKRAKKNGEHRDLIIVNCSPEVMVTMCASSNENQDQEVPGSVSFYPSAVLVLSFYDGTFPISPLTSKIAQCRAKKS